MPAAKKPAFMSESAQGLNWDAIDSFLAANAPAPQVEPTGFARTQGDRALALGQGLVGGVKMLSDLAGADNPVSETLGEANEALQGLYSPARIAEMRARQQLIDQADEGGSTWEQVKARLGGIAEAPLQTTLQAAGSMAPTVAATLATAGVAPAAGVLGTAARWAAPLTIGAGMGVGSVKGQNYDAVLQKAKAQGYSDEQAHALAVQASEYSAANAGQQTLGGVLGALDAGTGAQRAIRNLVAPPARVLAKAEPGMLRRIATTAGEEALPEGLQGAQGQYAQNEAMNRLGFETDPMSGVVGSGVHDAVVGAMVGGPLGIPKIRQPEVGPLSRAANIAAGGIAPTVPTAPAVAGAPTAPTAPAAQRAVVPLTPQEEQTLRDNASARLAELTAKQIVDSPLPSLNSDFVQDEPNHANASPG